MLDDPVMTGTGASLSLLSMIHDENEYKYLCRQILAISTRSEHARANRIASQVDYNQINSTTDPLERRFAHYKSKIHQIWNESFHPTSVIETKIIIGTRNNPNLNKELLDRSPRLQKRKHEKQQ